MGELYIFGTATKIIVQDTAARLGISSPEDIQEINDKVLQAVTSEYISIRKEYIPNNSGIWERRGGARPPGDGSRPIITGRPPRPPSGNSTDADVVGILGSAAVGNSTGRGAYGLPTARGSSTARGAYGQPAAYAISNAPSAAAAPAAPSAAAATAAADADAPPNINALVNQHLASPPPEARRREDEDVTDAAVPQPKARSVYEEREAGIAHAEAVERLIKRKQQKLAAAQAAVDDVMEQLKGTITGVQRYELRKSLEGKTRVRDQAEEELARAQDHKPRAAVNQKKALNQLGDAVDALAVFSENRTVDGGIQMMYKLALAIQTPDADLAERQQCVTDLAKILGYFTKEVTPVLQEIINRRRETAPDLKFVDEDDDIATLKASHKVKNELKNKLYKALTIAGITASFAALATGTTAGVSTLGTIGTTVAASSSGAATAAIVGKITPLAKNLLGNILTVRPVPTSAELNKEYKKIIDDIICDLLSDSEKLEYGSKLTNTDCSIQIKPFRGNIWGGPLTVAVPTEPNLFQQRRHRVSATKARQQAWQKPILHARMKAIGLSESTVESAFYINNSPAHVKAATAAATAAAAAAAPEAPPPKAAPAAPRSEAAILAAERRAREALKSSQPQGHVLGRGDSKNATRNQRINTLLTKMGGRYTRKLSKRPVQRGGVYTGTYEEAVFVCQTLSAAAYNYFKTSGYTEDKARIGTCAIYSFLLTMNLLFNKVGVYTIDDMFLGETATIGGGKNVITTILKGIAENKPDNIIKQEASNTASNRKGATETANDFMFVFNALK